MRLRSLAAVTLLAAQGCSAGPDVPPDEPDGPAQESRLTFQAVDAGTGGALTDRQMRVRYLVRTPITLDAATVEEVASEEAYEVAHPVSSDSLVLEVRLEAPSYHVLDTVLAVPRGGTVGPLTVRMARRLDRTADAAPADAAPARRPTAAAATPTPRPTETAPAPPADGIDRMALQTGDQFFEAGRWLDAVTSYRAMPAPPDGSGAYAREWQDAMVRRAAAHTNLGEFAGAMDALEQAVALSYPHPAAHLRLAEIQCSVGRTEGGRQTAARLEERAGALPAAERTRAVAMARYEIGRCHHRDFLRAEGSIPRIRTGNQAVQAFEAFLEAAPRITGGGAVVTAAVADAQAKVAEIRSSLRGGG